MLLGVAACGGGPPTPEGAWRRIGAGQWRDVSWSLFEVEVDGRGRCLAIDLEPPPSEPWPEGAGYKGKRDICGQTANQVGRRPLVLPSEYWLEPRRGQYQYFMGTVRDDVSEVEAQNDDATAVLASGVLVAIFPTDDDRREVVLLTNGGARGRCTFPATVAGDLDSDWAPKCDD
jgi:hypothetical protein